jgi:hypothetical protein
MKLWVRVMMLIDTEQYFSYIVVVSVIGGGVLENLPKFKLFGFFLVPFPSEFIRGNNI